MLSKRKLQQLIYLTGCKPVGYTIITNGFDGCGYINVSTARVGNAIVRAMRDLASKSPDDYFPPSALERVTTPREKNNRPQQHSFNFDGVPDCVAIAMETEPDELPDCVAAAWDCSQ